MIDKIFCINFDPNRRLSVELEYSKLDIDYDYKDIIFDCIKYNELTLNKLHEYSKLFNFNIDKVLNTIFNKFDNLNNSALRILANYFSHLNFYYTALENKYNNFIVFEDNFTVNYPFINDDINTFMQLPYDNARFKIDGSTIKKIVEYNFINLLETSKFPMYGAQGNVFKINNFNKYYEWLKDLGNSPRVMIDRGLSSSHKNLLPIIYHKNYLLHHKSIGGEVSKKYNSSKNIDYDDDYSISDDILLYFSKYKKNKQYKKLF